MPNLTLFIDPDRIARAKEIARAHNSSLSALLRRHIDQIVDEDGRGRPPSLGKVVAILRGNRNRLAEDGLVHVSVFGSVARGEERPGSDLDLAVELAPGKDLFDMAGLAGILEELMGCRVDLASRTRLRGAAAAEAVDVF